MTDPVDISSDEQDADPATKAQQDAYQAEMEKKYWGGTPPAEKEHTTSPTSESLRLLGAGTPYPQRNE